MTDIDAKGDEILFAFQLAHPHPAPADVADWIRRHPEHRAAIMEHAASLLAVDAAGKRGEREEATDEALARGRSVAMDLLHRARNASGHATDDGVSLSVLLSSAGKTLPALAREIGAGRGMLTDYVAGRMAPPVRLRLTNAVSQALGVAAAVVEAAFTSTLASPLAARAKADGEAVALRRTYEEVVRTDSTMTDERKAFWLAED